MYLLCWMLRKILGVCVCMCEVIFKPSGTYPLVPLAMQLLNKIDLLSPDRRGALEAWFAANCTAERTLPISALNATNTAAVVDWVVSKLPEGPSMYPKVSGA